MDTRVGSIGKETDRGVAAGVAVRGESLLGLGDQSWLGLYERVQRGLEFSRLTRLQKAMDLSREQAAALVGISLRTWARRRDQGRLASDESDRLLRASRVMERTLLLFEGDRAAARRWLSRPQRALGGEIPMKLAASDVGAREVETLIDRLEHGVFP